MNQAAVQAGEIPLPPWAGMVQAYVLKVLEFLGKDNWELSVLFCNDAYIRSLNAQYRRRDEVTDILSFCLGETIREAGGAVRFLPGDIVISLETLRENARYFEISEDEELRRLLIHGILHLDGMDHETNEKTEPMLELQEKILADLTGVFILPAEAAG
jgi:probable rRNA maturation factor